MTAVLRFGKVALVVAVIFFLSALLAGSAPGNRCS